jgi:hypothetical protein
MIRHGIVRWAREDLAGHDQHVLLVSLWRFGFILKWRGKFVPATYDATFTPAYQAELDHRINEVVGDTAYPLTVPPDEVAEPEMHDAYEDEQVGHVMLLPARRWTPRVWKRRA